MSSNRTPRTRFEQIVRSAFTDRPVLRGALGLLRSGDLLMALGLVFVIGLIFVRVPPFAIDFLVSFNIALAVMVFLASLYASDLSALPSFPTVLLLATFYRLSLNISTTRLILLDADAGQIISGFGRFVVGGDLIVGGVVFCILMLIQFVVITRGAERIAEVSARFSLDAMPGKQLAIDNELRNGDIDHRTATARRAELDRESRTFGAMEGAMKFVKGDAIAGLVIAVVNLLGGLAIGVIREQLPLGEALQTYSLLTVGDGLVSQIPALLLSLSAGLLVTRVRADAQGGEPNLAGELVAQLWAQPRAPQVTAVMLFGLAVSAPLTGFPWLPFTLLGVVLLFMGWSRSGGGAAGSPAAPGGSGSVVLEVHPDLWPEFRSAPRPRRAAVLGKGGRLLAALPAEFTRATGIPLAPVWAEPLDPSVPVGTYRLRVHGALAAQGRYLPGHRVVFMAAEELARLLVPAEPLEIEDLVGVPCSVVSPEHAPAIDRLNPPPGSTWAEECLASHLQRALWRQAVRLCGVQETAEILNRVRVRQPALVADLVPERLSVGDVALVLHGLLKSGLPPLDARGILESLSRRCRKAAGPDELVRLVRRDMGSAWRRLFERGGRVRYYEASAEVLEVLGAVSLGAGPLDLEAVAEGIVQCYVPKAHWAVPPVYLVADLGMAEALQALLHDLVPGAAALCPGELQPSGADQRVALLRLGVPDPV